MTLARLGWLLTALLVGLAAIWFYRNFERTTENVYVGYQGEARRNPFLAAERLFARLGARATELRALPELTRLPEGGALLLAAPREALGAWPNDALAAWVARGGWLIVEAEAPGRSDALLERFGARRTGRIPRASKGREDPAGSIALPGHERPLRVELPRFARLQFDEKKAPPRLSWSAANASGVQLAALEHGKGRVLLATSLDFLRNPAIGMHDHAALAWWLVGEGRIAEIRVLHQPHKLSLAGWLWRHAWLVLLAAAAALVLWLWRVVPRFGPLAPDPGPGRRRLLDHLRAAGRFHWHAGEAGRLLESAREACLARVTRAHPEIASLEPAARHARLASLFALPAAEFERAFGAPPSTEPHEFTRRVALLQSLHERLARRPGARFSRRST